MIKILFQIFFYINLSTNKKILDENISSSNKNILYNNDNDSFNNRRLSTNDINHKIDNLIYIESIEDKVSYISSSKSEDGSIYITTNTEELNSNKRIIYKIKTNGTNYIYDYKIMTISSSIVNEYPLVTELKIKAKEYLVSLSHKGQFEVFDYKKNGTYYMSFFKLLNQNSVISKNTFTSLKYYDYSNYVLNAYVDKHDFCFLLQKFNYSHYNITKNTKIEKTEIIVDNAFKNSSVTCFEIENFIECLYTNYDYLYTVIIFKISNLEHIYNKTIEINPVAYDELFSKCIFIKENIGAFIYFIGDNQTPILKIMKFITNENEYQLKDYIEQININSNGIFPLGNNYIYNDIIKIDENNIFYISTLKDSIEIYIVMFKLLNNDQNVLINYYRIKITESYNIKLYKDINTFSLNNLLGIGMTNFNYELDMNKTYASFFLIGNYSLGNNVDIPNDINIFNEESSIKISELINISNNIFGYFCGIKITSLLNETDTGFYIYSNKQNKKINTNDLIYSNDIINFKINNNIPLKSGKYSIEYYVIVKEEDYDDFISYPNSVEYFPNNNNDFKTFFQPKIFYEKKSFFNFSFYDCYYTCRTCRYKGNDLNHQCEECSKDFPYSYITLNNINCVEKCPQNYIPNDNNICITLKEINNCKKFFYIDENLKINCINSNICIDKYPHIDNTIKNMCTNCLVKYQNKCYYECPKNTCIHQSANLDECIDINDNIKVINKICFENFSDITNNIKNMSDNNLIIENFPKLKVYAYDLDKNPNYFIKNNLTYIYFESIKEIIINKYNLDKNTKIYALLVDSPSKYSNSTINDYGFVLLLENGTELNLTKLEEGLQVNISLPIINLPLANYHYANIFSEQGYDIYNYNSSFYHDICTPGYINNNDIILSERKQEIYPNNISIGKSNCLYQLTDLINQRFIYKCDISDKNIYNKINYFEEEESNERLENYFLDVINYKILNCTILFYNIDNYRHNKAVIICSTCLFISSLLIIIFFVRSLPKIRISMYNEIPTDLKMIQLIKKSKRAIKNNTYINSNEYLSNPNKKIQNLNKYKKQSFNIKKIRLKLNSYESINQSSCKSNISMTQKNKRKTKKSSVSFFNRKSYNFNYKKKNNKIENGISNNLKDEDIEYDDLPLSLALKKDKRNIFKLFYLKLIEKIEVIDIFVNKNIKEMLLSKFCLVLLLELSMNALLYSDQIVSHKRHNYGRLDFLISLILSVFSNIFASIIGYYLERLIGFEEKLNNIKEIKKEIHFLRVFKIIMREIIIRVIIFFFVELFIIFFCTYYLFIFFTIYHKSQMSLIQNYVLSLLERCFIGFVITLLIVIFRKLGLYYNNKYIYNILKYLNKNF